MIRPVTKTGSLLASISMAAFMIGIGPTARAQTTSTQSAATTPRQTDPNQLDGGGGHRAIPFGKPADHAARHHGRERGGYREPQLCFGARRGAVRAQCGHDAGSSGYGATNFAFIRGIGQPDFSFAFEPRVGFYIDDVYYATTFGSVFDLLDLNRVEIERGPQGVLNGRNSVGGAIRLFSQQPKGDDSGYFEVTGGDYDRIDVKGMYDTALIPDHLFVRISAGEQHRDGYVERENFACLYPSLAGNLPNIGTGGVSSKACQTGTLGGIERYSAKLQIRAIINDKIEDNVSADFTDDLSEAAPTYCWRFRQPTRRGCPGATRRLPERTRWCPSPRVRPTGSACGSPGQERTRMASSTAPP